MDTNYAHGHPVGEECHCFDDLNQPVTTASSLPPQGENCCHRCDDHGGTEEHWNGCPCHKETSVKEGKCPICQQTPCGEHFVGCQKETPVEGLSSLEEMWDDYFSGTSTRRHECLFGKIRTHLAEERQRGREECADYLEKHVAMEKEHGRHEVAGALFAASCWMREAAKSPREGAEGK